MTCIVKHDLNCTCVTRKPKLKYTKPEKGHCDDSDKWKYNKRRFVNKVNFILKKYKHTYLFLNKVLALNSLLIKKTVKTNTILVPNESLAHFFIIIVFIKNRDNF